MYSFLSILSYKNKDIITKGKKGQLELWKKLTMSGTYIAHSLALSSTASKHFYSLSPDSRRTISHHSSHMLSV